ncbi:beta-galactosidase 10-like isoform X1 [Gossypium australe]|uniref:beta-galactosidase n=1 Tax=Gossypium australe TaxID=47621 RepID=A0A5B6V2A5_9ROSI|nr:beta-galactosidase 10-like isoform X1 [Gossypium australe]
MKIFFHFLLFCFFTSLFNSCFAGNVTYDRRSLIIDGQRKLLISAAIHYPRSVPAMWPGLVQTAKEGGVDVIESYVFWNGHELSPGKYNFEGRYDLVKFVKIVQQAGMYMILRIGPFVAAEWNFGGVPAWLHYVPGTVFRTDNEPFKYYMRNFTTYIVNLMKQEKLFAPQGGPIILAQASTILNLEVAFEKFSFPEPAGAKRYVTWAARMAVSQNIGVPWIMCQQDDAPDPVINTCNSFYCDQFTPNSPNKPKIWTENWPGWFKTFGARDPHRPAEDVAFSVARFFQKGGSVHNYYMYHGGTNFGRTSGGPFITTSYDYEAPIDEYGLPRLPKWGHLKELHKAIKLSEHALLKSEPTTLSLGPSQEADVYDDGSEVCAAFLANLDDKTDKNVVFRNVSYHLPSWSVSILPDCKNVVFNTAKVGSQASLVEMMPEELTPSVTSPSKGLKALKWDVFVENAGIWGVADFAKNGFVDHINTTKDTTDYLWYTTRFIGLQGEHLSIYKPDGLNSINWVSTSEPPKNQPLTWYKVVVDSPSGDEPVGLDMIHMGKGLAWLNGEEIGRYWPIKSSEHEKCVEECDYRGKFFPDKCLTGCGEPTQRCLSIIGELEATKYHVPRSWFKPSGNILVIFEEKGGDPTKITFSKRKISGLCSLIAEDFPMVDQAPVRKGGSGKSAAHLKCPKNTLISNVKFASFGNPTGKCGSYSKGECHDPNSTLAVEKVCLGKNECAIELTEENFDKGLCPGTTKRLAIEAVCS